MLTSFFKHINFKRLFLFGGILCVITPFIMLFFCVILAVNGNWGELPDFEELENPQSNLATEIISSDNTLIGKYFYENRTHIEFDNLSKDLINFFAIIINLLL